MVEIQQTLILVECLRSLAQGETEVDMEGNAQGHDIWFDLWQVMKYCVEQSSRIGANSPGTNDRKIGNIGAASESRIVTSHGIFNINVCEIRTIIPYIYCKR